MMSLAARLRAETRRLHGEAEQSPFMVQLLGGRMDRPAYAALLHNLRAIYAALEPALLHHARHPSLAWLDVAALARSRSLEDDLRTLADVLPKDDRLERTTSHYVLHLRGPASKRPQLLVAHAYVRYLGDLSGGQLLRDIIARSPQLAEGTGTAFYDFGDAASVARLVAAFRVGLDAARVQEPGTVVEEAKLAFQWHRRLFDELARATGAGAGPAKVG